METILYLGAAALIVLLFAYQAYQSNKINKRRLKRMIEENWGNRPGREYSYEEFENLTHFYQQRKDGSWSIDDITWNDLDMDSIFMLLNNTYSSVGEEYLYDLLRRPSSDKEVLAERNRLADYFLSNTDQAKTLEECFAYLGRAKKISFYEYFMRLVEMGPRNSSRHYMALACLFASIGIVIVQPALGIIAVIAMLVYNITGYYRMKAEVENYFICVKFIVRMIQAAQRVTKLNIKELEDYNQILKKDIEELKPLCKGVFMITSNQMSGNIQDIMLDYVRMITHMDLLKFNSMLGLVIKKIDVVTQMYETLGKIESGIAIASFREYCNQYGNGFCRPEFDRTKGIRIADVYHPLISEPVLNSIDVRRSVLLTGSNASGKSTFLKTVAISAVLAETIDTCTASSYQAPFYHIYSSMALRDDLQSKESYFIVEIKSLKRIVDSVSEGEQVLCFVDEVLRGTNTVERIAASSRILKTLNVKGAECFAATHDVELTHILENDYENYHFQEKVEEDDVIFDYKLYQGRATSRNAIKLLGVMGYDKSIIKDAEAAANEFLTKGSWDHI